MFALGNSSTIFARVAVLDDEVAAVAGEHKIIYDLFRSFGHLYRFADVGKTIGSRIFGQLISSSGLVNNGFGVLPLLIAKQALKVASQPELNTVFCLPGVGFKVVGEGLDDFGFHVFVPVLSEAERR